MNILLILLVTLSGLLLSILAVQQYLYHLLQLQRRLCRSKGDSIKQRLNSLPSFPPFERPGRNFSVFSRFRKISRTNIGEDEIYESENNVEVIKSMETALWKISKGFERPRESRRTLNKEALNRTESFRRSPGSGSVSEQSDDESYMRISFSFGQRSFPVIDSLPDTMM